MFQSCLDLSGKLGIHLKISSVDPICRFWVVYFSHTPTYVMLSASLSVCGIFAVGAGLFSVRGEYICTAFQVVVTVGPAGDDSVCDLSCLAQRWSLAYFWHSCCDCAM